MYCDIGFCSAWVQISRKYGIFHRDAELTALCIRWPKWLLSLPASHAKTYLPLRYLTILLYCFSILQFYRSFPGPPDVTEAEMRLVAKKHRHPDKAGLCNYLQFHDDIVQRQQGRHKQALHVRTFLSFACISNLTICSRDVFATGFSTS